ncbi:hypothetical protein PPERSA_11764 [Pseudocohnilembus persalinus]|uniref:Uncharacterized protein n=1 Tax=Pseudocohnilembus persalinus TaxID=266149 RepID=A0A0V0QGU5_PSEPJ|nr:hypothetical protein PPERSA_11764 [Pseudocohnilembus persalinus]|eukprot:KRX01317.1 hypothetical protein PPERSA_11764 [Pseudocohnilembus persalinus]
MKQLSVREIDTLIVTYEAQNNKNYYMFDLVIEAIEASQNKAKNFKKIIDFLLDTPPIAFQNQKGTSHSQIKNLFKFQNLDNLFQNLAQNQNNQQLNVEVQEQDQLEKIETEIEKQNDNEKNQNLNQNSLQDEQNIDILENKELVKIYDQEQQQLYNNEQNLSFTEFMKPNIQQNNIIEAILLIKKMELKQLIPELSSQAEEILQLQFQGVLQYANLLTLVNYLKQIEEVWLQSYQQSQNYFMDNQQQQSSSDEYDSQQNQKQTQNQELYCKFIDQYMPFIENFYLNNKIQKYDNVIVDYLKFFTQFQSQNMEVFNQIIKDLINILQFKQVKAYLIYQIIQTLSYKKINHNQLFELIFTKCFYQNSLKLYKLEAQDIIFYLSKLGYISEKYSQIQCNLLNLYSNQEFKIRFSQPTHLLWSLLLQGQFSFKSILFNENQKQSQQSQQIEHNEEELLTQDQKFNSRNKNSHVLFQNNISVDQDIQQQLLKSFLKHLEKNIQSLSNKTELSLLLDIYNFIQCEIELNKEKFWSLDNLQQNQNMQILKQIIEILENNINNLYNSRHGNYHQFKKLDQILEQQQENYNLEVYYRYQIQNISQKIQLDYFFPKQKIGVCIESGIYTNIDKVSPSGYSLMREIINKKIQNGLPLNQNQNQQTQTQNSNDINQVNKNHNNNNLQGLKIIYINKWQFQNLRGDDNEQIQYLVKQGLPLYQE